MSDETRCPEPSATTRRMLAVFERPVAGFRWSTVIAVLAVIGLARIVPFIIVLSPWDEAMGMANWFGQEQLTGWMWRTLVGFGRDHLPCVYEGPTYSLARASHGVQAPLALALGLMVVFLWLRRRVGEFRLHTPGIDHIFFRTCTLILLAASVLCGAAACRRPFWPGHSVKRSHAIAFDDSTDDSQVHTFYRDRMGSYCSNAPWLEIRTYDSICDTSLLEESDEEEWEMEEVEPLAVVDELGEQGACRLVLTTWPGWRVPKGEMPSFSLSPVVELDDLIADAIGEVADSAVEDYRPPPLPPETH